MASTRAHINPDMLVWARKRINATPEQIARRVVYDEEITDFDELPAQYEALREKIGKTRRSLNDELESALSRTI